MEKILKNKKKLIVACSVFVLCVLGLVMLFGTINKHVENNNKGTDSKSDLNSALINYGKEFYEDYYYIQLGDEKILSNFQESGLNITINNLDVILPIDESLKNKLVTDKCDLDKTKILIYPKEPYGIKDYNIKVELTCEK